MRPNVTNPSLNRQWVRTHGAGRLELAGRPSARMSVPSLVPGETA
jgi:hypothetical protein